MTLCGCHSGREKQEQHRSDNETPVGQTTPQPKDESSEAIPQVPDGATHAAHKINRHNCSLNDKLPQKEPLVHSAAAWKGETRPVSGTGRVASALEVEPGLHLHRAGTEGARRLAKVLVGDHIIHVVKVQ